ncbi:MAG: hypothetical protein N3D11_17260 [Candidatus Sumerlaeia bacterium]|nr:hypothetical protein [Candidatus Sumerlaeia bacterium]
MKNLRTTTGALMVAAMLAGLTGVQAQDRGGGSPFGGFSRSSRPIARVTAVADERSNSVIVSAPEEMIPLIEALIQDIENITTGTTQVRVFPLQYAYARDMATVFTDLFREQSSSGRGSSSVQRAVAVADERTNSVVVSAPEDIMRTIERIVKEVDTMSEDVTELRVFMLQYAKAEDTAQMINDIFEQRQSRTSSRNQPMPFGRGSFGFFGRSSSSSSSQQSERRLQEETVVAVADTRTNSVIVKAASEIMIQIEAMIKQIDENPAREKKVYVYSLGNADVSDLSTILQQLFPASSQGGGGARFGGQTNTQSLRPTSRGTGTGTSGRPASGSSGFGGSGGSGFGSLN